MLLNEDMSKGYLENIEKIGQHLLEVRQRNTENAAITGDQPQGTTVDLSAPEEPVANTTGRRTTTNNNIRSPVDKENDQKVMKMQASRLGNQPRPSTRTNRTKSHYYDRSSR